MPVRPAVEEPEQPEGRSFGPLIAFGCALVICALGYGAWRFGAFSTPVQQPTEQAEEAETTEETTDEGDVGSDAQGEETSTYSRPTEPWDKDASGSGGNSGSGQGSQSYSGGPSSAYQGRDGSPSDDDEPVRPAPKKDDQAPKPEEAAPSEPEAAPDDGVAVHDGLADYSWAELAALAGRIESCSSQQEALEVAKRHHLVDDAGSFTDATHEVTLEDGTTMRVRLVGVWHDRADTPSGRAALTFLSSNVVGRHTFGDTETVTGGWEASSLRSWMASDLLGLLPDDLEQAVKPVYKRANRSMSEVSPSMVTDTLDRLWAPSIIELCGPIAWEYHTEPEEMAPLYNSVFNEEGVQYAAFAQTGIDDYGPNAIFSLGDDWWLRSCSPRSGRGRFVGTDGDPSYITMANEEKGVVVGFCL